MPWRDSNPIFPFLRRMRCPRRHRCFCQQILFELLVYVCVMYVCMYLCTYKMQASLSKSTYVRNRPDVAAHGAGALTTLDQSNPLTTLDQGDLQPTTSLAQPPDNTVVFSGQDILYTYRNKVPEG
jgi:hypothetical protein